MIVTLNLIAVEESTYIILAAFKDEDNQPGTPNWLKWYLTDEDATVINSREDVVITPDTTVAIVLTGPDLSIQAAETGIAYNRIVTLKGEYDSITYGNDLAIKAAVKFPLENLVAES